MSITGEYRIEIPFLTEEELIYECQARGISDIEDTDELREGLKVLLESGDNSVQIESKYEFDAEFKKVEGKIEEIRILVDGFTSGISTQDQYSIITTKLAHTLGRFNRIAYVSRSQNTARSRTLIKIIGLIGIMKAKLKTSDGSQHSTPQKPALAPSVTFNLTGVEASHTTTSFNLDTSSGNNSRFKLESVAKWNLRFSGDGNSMSVNAFLDRVEELRYARQVDFDLLLRSGCDLFEGSALMWYRANRSHFESWADLIQALRAEFLPPEYDERLIDDIKRRTQGPHEKIGMYVAIMTNLFNRLSGTVSEDIQLKIILRNLAPFYLTQIGFAEIMSIKELIEIGKKIDCRKYRVEAYSLPPTKRSTLEPDLAYVGDGDIAVAVTKETCWNCREEGHLARSCNKPKKVYCHGCGLGNVFRTNCPRCSSENGRGPQIADRALCADKQTNQPSLSRKEREYINFILAQVENDNRPYLEVDILGIKILGLLDSGANRTVMGRQGWEKLKSLNFELRNSNMSITVANGESCLSAGVANVPYRVRGQVKIVETLVIPELNHSLILGADFWDSFGIILDLKMKDWTFSNDISSCNNQINSISSRENLTLEQKRIIDATLNEIFVGMKTGLGRTSLVEHRIFIDPRVSPIKQRYYPVSPTVQTHLNRELDQMLKDGVIEKSNSPWSSPILLLKKKDDSYRFVVDFRKINKISVPDAYAIPYMSHILDRLRDAKYLSSLDIKSAYWQIPLEPESKRYTAFVVPNRGLFQFNVMPMGLRDSGATWQRFIDNVIGYDLEPHVFVYLDDIIIIASTFEKHMEILSEVLRRIIRAGLTLNKDKCLICRSELKYLGYVVNGEGLNVDVDKVRSILEIPIPVNAKDVRRVLGMVSYYRRFIPNFSTIAAPLTNLLRKKVRFAWNTECDGAFNELKNCLVAAPIMSCPDFALPFVVQTDASDFGLGAVLSQNTVDGEKVVCYLSRSLNKCERKYSTTEKECLAVLFAVEKLRPYLEGAKFTVVTDHHSLIWLNNLQCPTGRLARWAVRMQQFDFDIIHRKGKDNVVPDALSRAVPAIEFVLGENEEISDPWYNALKDKIVKDPVKYSRFRVKGNWIWKYVKSRYPDLDEDNFAWKLVVPKEKREKLLYRCHDLPNAGHGGSYKTYERLRVKHTWPRMRGDVERYVRRCKVCAASKPEQKRTAGLMATRRTASKPWEMIAMDCIGPLPPSTRGYRYILVITDCFSKFVLTFPLRSITAAAVCRCVEEHIFLMFGSPRWIICDNGKEFKNKEFQKLARSFGCVIQYNANYHPQANPTERVNRVIKTMLTCYVSENHRKWDKFLPAISCAIRTARHEVTGLTPYFINFGREMTALGSETEVPVEGIDAKRSTDYVKRSDEMNNVYKDVRERLTKAHARYKVRYDLRKRDIEYLPNQLVWKRNFVLSDASKYYAAKLAPKFVGPFKIKKKVSPWTYELEDLKGGYKGMFHAKDLKPADRDPEDDELS